MITRTIIRTPGPAAALEHAGVTPNTRFQPPEGDMAGTGQWFPDPTGRGDRRYWDGQSWTDQISRRGINVTDTIATGYARPEQFCFHEENALHTKRLERAAGAAWRDAFGRLHGRS